MQTKKLLTALNPLARAQEIRENWFPWVVVLIGAAVQFFSVTSATEALVRNQIEAARLEQIGTGWVLFGALWTALGAHLTKKDREALDDMANQNVLDVKEIVRIFKVASNFSTYGAFMIALGTAVLLYKMYLH